MACDGGRSALSLAEHIPPADSLDGTTLRRLRDGVSSDRPFPAHPECPAGIRSRNLETDRVAGVLSCRSLLCGLRGASGSRDLVLGAAGAVAVLFQPYK